MHVKNGSEDMNPDVEKLTKSQLFVLIAVSLFLIGLLIVFSDLFLQTVDVSAIAIGIELQLLGLGLFIVGKK